MALNNNMLGGHESGGPAVSLPVFTSPAIGRFLLTRAATGSIARLDVH
jgi:hypothetical protein